MGMKLGKNETLFELFYWNYLWELLNSTPNMENSSLYRLYQPQESRIYLLYKFNTQARSWVFFGESDFLKI